MNRLISDILQAPEPHFSHAVRSWEQLSGRSGHDVRLISDITQTRLRALEQLQLDKTDTTAKELYYALRHRATQTNLELEKHLGITAEHTADQVTHKIVAFVESLEVSREVWTIKHSTIKHFLKKQPPKKLMKVLGLRSIDSVLKRGNVNELLVLAYQIETPEWTNKIHNFLKKLQPSDFQSATSALFQIEASKIQKLYKGGFNATRIIIPNYETGTIIIAAPKSRFVLDTLALSLSVIESLYNLRVYSAYFRHSSVKSDFGDHIYSVITNGLPGKLHSDQIGWKALQKHFNNNPELFNRIEQPHLQYEDIELTNPVELLQNAIPSAEFWVGKDHIFMPDKQKPVSMHLMDVVIDASNQRTYENSQHLHLRSWLWDELALRYLQNEAVETMVIEIIDTPSNIQNQ